jgi:hypothetical protein
MKFLFNDASFSFETLRTTGFAAYGGADLGEIQSHFVLDQRAGPPQGIDLS